MVRASIQRNKYIAAIVLVVACLGAAYGLRPTPTPIPAPTPEIPATAEPLTPPEPAPTIIPQVTDGKSQTILELFSPSDPYLTQQLNETALSQQIEQIITTSFVLTKCNLMTADEYRDNFRALIVYAQRMKLAPDMVAAEATIRRIAESAGTSYALVYSRTKCDDPALQHTTQQLLAWQKAYLNN